MPEHPRIEELRRRVQTDPASIAFAQLAEEYRRSGNYDDAVATCRAGLQIHPGYLSARVTLGRSLIEMKNLDEAETELTYVLQHASENLSAMRGMAEIHHRRGNLVEALAFYRNALDLAKHDPDLEQAVAEISRTLGPEPAPVLEEDGLTFEEASAEFLSALEELSVVKNVEPARSVAPRLAAPEGQKPALAPATSPESSPAPSRTAAPAEPETGSAVPGTALPVLERFLEAIHTYRRKAV
jgi:tetratricopeptide (TPR) repeat protein